MGPVSLVALDEGEVLQVGGHWLQAVDQVLEQRGVGGRLLGQGGTLDVSGEEECVTDRSASRWASTAFSCSKSSTRKVAVVSKPRGERELMSTFHSPVATRYWAVLRPMMPLPPTTRAVFFFIRRSTGEGSRRVRCWLRHRRGAACHRRTCFPRVARRFGQVPPRPNPLGGRKAGHRPKPAFSAAPMPFCFHPSKMTAVRFTSLVEACIDKVYRGVPKFCNSHDRFGGRAVRLQLDDSSYPSLLPPVGGETPYPRPRKEARVILSEGRTLRLLLPGVVAGRPLP